MFIFSVLHTTRMVNLGFILLQKRSLDSLKSFGGSNTKLVLDTDVTRASQTRHYSPLKSTTKEALKSLLMTSWQRHKAVNPLNSDSTEIQNVNQQEYVDHSSSNDAAQFRESRQNIVRTSTQLNTNFNVDDAVRKNLASRSKRHEVLPRSAPEAAAMSEERRGDEILRVECTDLCTMCHQQGATKAHEYLCKSQCKRRHGSAYRACLTMVTSSYHERYGFRPIMIVF